MKDGFTGIQEIEEKEEWRNPVLDSCDEDMIRLLHGVRWSVQRIIHRDFSNNETYNLGNDH
jgi:hypothetical protein